MAHLTVRTKKRTVKEFYFDHVGTFISGFSGQEKNFSIVGITKGTKTTSPASFSLKLSKEQVEALKEYCEKFLNASEVIGE